MDLQNEEEEMSAYGGYYNNNPDGALSHAKEHMAGLLEDLFITGNVEDLIFHLDEVCEFFEIKLPLTPLAIEPKQNEKDKQTQRMLQNWVGYTRAYAEFMSGNLKGDAKK